MTPFNLILLAGLAVAPSVAHHLGPVAPPKFDRPMRSTHTHPVQGGDTFADAFPVDALPFVDAGTTAGYANDYDAICPYDGSIAPDVVYRLLLDQDRLVDVDMCGSAYDTKIYLYGEGMELVACNDDHYFDDECGVYVSKLEAVPIAAGVKHFLVIDGYGDAAGDYALLVEEYLPCVVDCPPDALLEGEPELVDGYEDSWNGGCNSDAPHFQTIDSGPWDTAEFCGVAGWYWSQGTNHRDTDWFRIYAGWSGTVSVEIDAESETFFFELGPRDCDEVAVLQQATGGPCAPGTMEITADPGTEIWVWAGSSQYAAPPGFPGNEYDYVLWFEGLLSGWQPLATERATWGAVKSLYR